MTLNERKRAIRTIKEAYISLREDLQYSEDNQAMKVLAAEIARIYWEFSTAAGNEQAIIWKKKS